MTPATAKAAKPARKQAAKAPQKPLTPWQQWSADPERAIDELCSHVTEGGHLAEFAKARSINYTTVLQWLKQVPERAEMYARAREERADKLADEIVAISDEIEVQNVIGDDGEVVEVKMDATAVARNRLRVDARKWVAAKLKPRTYGDRTTLAGDPEAPVETKLSGTVNVTNAPLDEYLKAVRGT